MIFLSTLLFIFAGGIMVLLFIVINKRQLQRKFKHAGIFGIEANYNSETEGQYNNAIQKHIGNTNTQKIVGTYRTTIKVFHFFNSQTKVNVITSRTEQFISTWKLSEKQIECLLETGNIQ